MADTSFDRPANAFEAALAECKPRLVQVAAFSVLLNLLGLAPVLFMLQVYDRAIPSRSLSTLAMLALIYLLAMSAMAAIDFARGRLLTRAGVRLDRLLSRPVLDALIRRDGEAPNAAALRNLDTLRQAASGPTLLALLDAPWTPVYILVAALVHPWVGAMALVGAIVLVIIAVLGERRTSPLVARAAAARSHAYAGIDRMLAHAALLDAFGLRERFLESHGRGRDAGVSLNLDASFAASSYVTAARMLRMLLQSLGLGLGAWLAIDDKITGGAVFAASLLIGKALQPIEQITGAWRSLGHARVAFAGLRALFAATPAPIVRTRLPDPRGALAVEELSVCPLLDAAPVLEALTFDVAPGQMIGVIGQSGAGKSTLARALAGVIRPSAGQIRLDGAALGDWPRDQLAQAIGYVPQEPILFEGTVADNIAGFPSQRTAEIDAEIMRVTKLCGAHDFILRLPHAYDTVVAPGMHFLSAGQAQGVAIARALYGRPKLLVLDEPNASIDAAGEIALVRALSAARAEGAAVVVVAHRQAVLADVDKLLLLVRGRMAAFGDAAEVRARIAEATTPALLSAAA